MKKAILLVTLIALATTVTAFSANLEPIKQTTNSSSPAKFQLTVENPTPRNHSYSISILSPKSSWFYYKNSIKVPANSNKSTNITVSSLENSIQRRYRFDGKVREQRSGEKQSFTGFFNVQQPYKIHVTDLIIDKKSIEPGEVISSQITIKNLYNQPISNYEVTSKYEKQTKTESGTEILPGGTRKYEFNYKTPKNATPGEKTIKYEITANEKTQNQLNQTFTIQEIQNITKTETKSNKILIYSKEIAATNKGNSNKTTTITAQIPSYLESITTTTPEPQRKETLNGKTVYTWQQELQPNQKTTAKYQTNYSIPLAASTLLILGIIAIKLIGNNIMLTKTAEKTEENVKIRIEIENTGEKTYEKLILEEFIPDIATVDKQFSMNTPKIRETSEGTKLTWEIIDLEPGDQRIIQYNIKPKVQVEEEVELEKAVIKNTEDKQVAESNKANTHFQT